MISHSIPTSFIIVLIAVVLLIIPYLIKLGDYDLSVSIETNIEINEYHLGEAGDSKGKSEALK